MAMPASAGVFLSCENTARSAIKSATLSHAGATNSASKGESLRVPIQTGSFLHFPGVWCGWPSMRTACIVWIDSTSMCSAKSSAARIAFVLATISSALPPRFAPNSALRTLRALAVKCSIWDDDAASDLSKTGAKVATRSPSSESKRCSSPTACSDNEAVSLSRLGVSPAILGGTALQHFRFAINFETTILPARRGLPPLLLTSDRRPTVLAHNASS